MGANFMQIERSINESLGARGAYPHKILRGGGGCELDCGTDFPKSDIQI